MQRLVIFSVFLLLRFADAMAASSAVFVAAQTLDASRMTSETIAVTLDSVRYSLPDKFELHYYDNAGLVKAVENSDKPLSFFITDPLTFSRQAQEHGAWALALMKHPQAADGTHTTAAAFIVRENSKLRYLNDLRGSHAMATSPSAYESYVIGMEEIRRVFGQTEDFFAKTTFVGSPIEDVVHRIIAGEADIGIVDACLLEKMEANGNIGKGLVRVISERKSQGLGCRHSTELYPGWVFAAKTPLSAMTTQDKAFVAELTASLLNIPDLPDTYRWDERVGRAEIQTLTAALADIRDTAGSWQTSFLRYKNWIVGFVLCFIFLVIHSFYVSWRVKFQTRKLTQALADRDRMEKLASQEREQIANMERAGIAGQLSSMLAHELQQPINAITNFSRGIRLRIDHGTIEKDELRQVVTKITDLSQRAGNIVSRVRNYSRKRIPEHRPDDLVKVAEDTVCKFKSNRPLAPEVKLKLPSSACVECDRLEIELLIYNLLKNAQEACQGIENPEIVLEIVRNGKYWHLCVSDNGKVMSAEDMRVFFAPLRSTKENGLGLGLSICRTIAEAHGGNLTASRRQVRGITMLLEIPVLEAEASSKG